MSVAAVPVVAIAVALAFVASREACKSVRNA